MKQKKTMRRLPPCAVLDIERLESWLTDMAAEGWHLKDTRGLWSLCFVFEKGEPRNVRYRLEPGRGAFDDDKPDYHAREFFKDMGWEAVSGYGQFFIFRAVSGDVPELNTDPAVQLIAMKKLRRKTLFWNFLALVLIPVMLLYWSRDAEPYRFIVTFGFASAAVLVLLFCYCVVELVVQIVQANAIVKKLKTAEQLDHSKPWRKGAWYHRLSALMGVLCYAVYMLSMLTQCTSDLANYGRDIEKYEGDPPFVTIQDLCPEGEYTRETFLSEYYNDFTQYSSDCAPLSIEWDEYAEVVSPDGEVYSGTLIIHYHETASEWIARGLAEEYYRVALKERYHHELEAPDLDVDFVGAYTLGGLPTLILQEGNVVITASIGVQKDGEYVLMEWAELMIKMLDQ